MSCSAEPDAVLIVSAGMPRRLQRAAASLLPDYSSPPTSMPSSLGNQHREQTKLQIARKLRAASCIVKMYIAKCCRPDLCVDGSQNHRDIGLNKQTRHRYLFAKAHIH